MARHHYLGAKSREESMESNKTLRQRIELLEDYKKHKEAVFEQQKDFELQKASIARKKYGELFPALEDKDKTGKSVLGQLMSGRSI